jgi:hypothetical protein
MKTNLSLLLLLLAFSLTALLATGCYSTPDGRMRAGMPVVTDTITSRYERPVDQIFSAAKEVLSFNGTLYGENTITKTLEAKIDTRSVWVTVHEVEPNVSQVRVQARTKGGSADVHLASEIDKQIALRLPR